MTLSSVGVLVSDCKFLAGLDVSFKVACLRVLDNSVLFRKLPEVDETESSCECTGKVDGMLKLPSKGRKSEKTWREQALGKVL